MIDLKDYSLIITGAGSGIGLTTAALANSLGARVAGTVQGQAQHAALARYLDDEAIFDLDVRDTCAIDQAVQSSIDLFGKLDGAVAGAGIIEFLASTETTNDAWARVLDVNLPTSLSANRRMESLANGKQQPLNNAPFQSVNCNIRSLIFSWPCVAVSNRTFHWSDSEVERASEYAAR